MARDTRCRFPGCSARRCDAHHLTHWAEGGATRLDNLVLLCRRHHRAVHEGGFRIVRADDGEVQVFRPDGRRLEVAPSSPRVAPHTRDPLGPTVVHLAAAGIAIGPYTSTPHWDGEPFDVAWAIDVLRESSTEPCDHDRQGAASSA